MHHQHSRIDTDLPHILDPAYSSSSSSRASCSTSASSTSCPLSRTTSSSSSFYVDPQGNMHEPSYRMFVTASPTPKPTTLCSTSSTRRRRPSKPHRSFAQQPSAEFGDDICESDEDIDSDAYSPESFATYPRSTSPHPNVRIPSSPRTISSPLPWAPTTSGGLPNYSPPDPESPFIQRVSVPDEMDSGSDEDAGSVEARPHIRSRWSGKRVTTATPTSHSEISHEDDEITSSSQPHLSPIKQHWETASMRFQFGLYHARQKLATHLTGPRGVPHVASAVISF